MPGVTEQEIAQAKQMNLYQYMQLCEPDNFKPEGPGQFRHKGHSSLTFAEDGSWTYFKTKATGRTALNYLIAVEGVSFVEAVREINRIQGGVRPSFQPVKAPSPPAEKKPAKEFRLPKPDKNNYAATAYLRKRCISFTSKTAFSVLSKTRLTIPHNFIRIHLILTRHRQSRLSSLSGHCPILPLYEESFQNISSNTTISPYSIQSPAAMIWQPKMY